MKRKPEAIENPRRLGKHVQTALAYLDEIGATGVEVRKNGHLRISWHLNSFPMRITLSSSPKSEDECGHIAKQLIRRAVRDCSSRVPALGEG